MAATKDKTAGSGGYASAAGGFVPEPVFSVGNTLDCSVAANNATATDIMQMVNVLAWQLVLLVGFKVIVAAGGTSAIDIGDGTNDDAFIDSANGNATAGTVLYSQGTYTNGTGDVNMDSAFTNALFTVLGGKTYSAADTIDAVFDNNDTAGKYALRALVINLFP